MTLALIGSRALAFRVPKLYALLAPKDFDFIGHEIDIEKWVNSQELGVQPVSSTYGTIYMADPPCEFEKAEARPSGAIFLEFVNNDSEAISTKFGVIPNLDLLFTLKASHRYLKDSPHFWKTAKHYHLMKSLGAKIRPEYKEFLKIREKETYTNKLPKLNVSKKDFFSEEHGVKYIYDHDDIHISVKTFDRPAYTFFKKDNEEVLCDKSKFFQADQSIRLASVVEEAAVLAIERSLVPFPGKVSPQQAWMFALSKVCSSITSGWWREWAYDHIFDVVKLYNPNYWDKFQEDVKLGLINHYQG